MPSKITLLAPERLHHIIARETSAGRREAFAMALLRLIELHTDYLKREDGKDRLGTILPLEESPGSSIRTEISWGIIVNPVPTEYGGIQGDHVLNGGLIQSADHTWSNHT